MGAFFEQLLILLTTPPGNLVYHAVLAFSIFGALQASINHWRSSSFPQGRRMVVGLALLLLGQFALFAAAGLAWLLAGAWFADADRRHEWSLAWTYLTGGASREEYLTSVSGDYPAFAYANQHLPQDAVVLLAPFESRGFYLDHSYIWANPIGQRLFKMEQIPDVAAFAGTLRRMGVTHILFNTRIAVTDIRHWTHIDGLFRGLVDTEGHLLFSSAESSLYELRSGSQ